MSDMIHRAFKTLDHYRGTAIAGVVAVGLLSFTGCSSFDAKIPSSQTGQVVTADEREAEYTASLKTIGDEITVQQATITQAAAKIDTLVAQAETVDEDFQFDLARLNAEIERRNQIIDSTVGVVRATLPAAAPILDLLLPIVGASGLLVAGGVTYDNRRKDRVIKQAKAGKTEAAS